MGQKLITVVAVLMIVGVGVIVRQVLDSDDAPAAPGARDRVAPADPRKAVRMPGVAAGDAALTTVSMAEAIRRCQLRWNTVEGRPMPSITSVFGPDDGTFNAGEQVVVSPTPISVDDLSQPPRADMFFCDIPGDLMPGKAELAAAADDRVPAERQAMLRRCSTVVWHDLSTWTVVTSSVAGGTAGALIALSPSGRYVAHCWLVGKTLGDAYFVGYAVARIRPASEAPRGMRDYSGQYPGHYFQDVWDTCRVPGVPCLGQLYLDATRLPRTVTKVRLDSIRGGPPEPVDGTMAVPVAGPSTTVTVKDGWFAVAWADGLSEPCGRARLTAYDARNRIVRVVSDPPSRMGIC